LAANKGFDTITTIMRGIHSVKEIIPQTHIENKVFIIRGIKVMIDRDLAELYGVETKNLNRQVKRNSERFPAEFMFKIAKDEKDELVTNWHRFQCMFCAMVVN
jgi:hypothetical protein